MKRRSKKMLLGLVLLMISLTGAQAGDFSYRCEIKGVTGTWHKLVLPANVMGKVKPDLIDIRIIGVTANNDTIQAPYMGNLNIEAESEIQPQFKVLNQTKNAKGYYYTFQIEDGKSINYIALEFNEKNFDWKVNLSASNDQLEWFTVLDDYRLVSIKNNLTDYHFTTLNFPESKYRYYRLFIPGTSKPGLAGARIIKQVLTPGVYRPCQIKKTTINTDKQLKQTTIDIELAENVPVSWLSLHVTDHFDFYRPVVVMYLEDSTKTVKGWDYLYTELTVGTLSSLEKPVFRFSNMVTRHVQVVISNGDNAPLHIDSVSLQGNVYSLTARFDQTATWYMYYGNRSIGSPDYDIANFKDKIPAGLTELTIGNEEVIPKQPVKIVKPLFENKMWLWVIMAIIILLLGWFSVKMINTKN